ncbi:Pathogenesis-related protein R major form [Cardamine amara subsp. amara]|uniref:Pathogenesis-related protein R major form n=1 Tax=Cardamine amara subsp. amara TaxID=228776 RepID=A0ABD1AQK7_CARAN
MVFLKTLPIIFFFAFLILYLVFPADAATITVRNNCPYVVWAAGTPGGGKRLETGGIWTVNANPGTVQARIWGRTDCNFDASGRGSCRTGDCGGLLECTSYGQPPNTLAEYALTQYANQDFYDISVIDGFNIPMEFSSASGNCKVIRCTADIIKDCPDELRKDNACNGPCPMFRREEDCCNVNKNCGPTPLSSFFKQRCPDVYTYPNDGQTGQFACPTGNN